MNNQFDGTTAIQANRVLIKNQNKSRGHRIAKSYNFEAGSAQQI